MNRSLLCLAIVCGLPACNANVEAGRDVLDASSSGHVDATSSCGDADAAPVCSPGKDAADLRDGGFDVGDAAVAADVTDGGSACDDVDASDGQCVVCGGLWYCPANPPAPQCPDEGMGACQADSPGCFTCQGGASVSFCECGSDGGVDDDGGDTDAGPMWGCQPAEFGCPKGV